MLDSVINFLPTQVRNIMKVLAVTSHLPQNRESERFHEEFLILRRKQLTSTNTKVKCVGVIGALATIDQLIQNQTPEGNSTSLFFTFIFIQYYMKCKKSFFGGFYS